MSSGGLLLDDPDRERPMVVRGKGVHLWDSAGKKYIDAAGGVHVVTIGHGVEEIALLAAEQARRVAFASTRHFVTEAAVHLAEVVTALLPDPLCWVYFVSSGSEATDMAIQLAYRYFVSRGEPMRTKIIGRWNSYHGGTTLGASVGGHTAHRERLSPYLLPFPHIDTPHCSRCPLGLSFPSCALRCADELDDVIEAEGPDTVAAFFAEPLIGTTGGAICPPPGYYERIREICDRHGVLFVADEVVTGFGRTGTNFGMDHWAAIPDVVTCSKGMTSGYAPLGAVVVHDDVVRTMRVARGNPGLRSTYSAHPVGCAVAVAVIGHVAQHGLVEQCRRRGTTLESMLQSLENDVDVVREVRGKGLLLGVELAAPDGTPFPRHLRFAESVADEARAAGLIVLAGSGTPRSADGDHLVLSPPYVITDEDCAEVVRILRRSVTAAAGRLPSRQGGRS